MPQQPNVGTDNNFSAGLKTEFTGLNFPPNATFDTENCIFNRIGNVTRRPGIDYETNFTNTTIDRTNKAINQYRWKNVGGDGSTQVLAVQVGATLRFYRSSTATIASPLSGQLLGSTIDISSFVSSGGTYDATLECQFTDGNGYLFVFHPSCDPFYCTYNAGTITASQITVQIKDFVGIAETGVADDFRPNTLTNEHAYNLQNQGWINGPAWTATSVTSNNLTTGTHTWTIQTGLTISAGQVVSLVGVFNIEGNTPLTATGTVTSYTSGSGVLVLNIVSVQISLSGSFSTSWTFASIVSSFVSTFKSATGVYPSNSDVWWTFKNSSNVFDPATTIGNIVIGGPAPKGHYTLPVFNQNRSTASSLTSLTTVSTLIRPKTGTWFQGRVWYTGVDAAFAASGDAPFSTWTETIYFSQVVVKPDQFGKCFQLNDPTSQTLFDLLPTDGGTIVIQGCGSIYKLFPIQNGLLAFTANGVYFITGSQGIGFAANDYTINKISAIQSISSTSFVDMRGTPMWWNEEGIYTVTAGQSDEGVQYGPSRGAVGAVGLNVNSISFATIQTFFDNIPLSSKKHVKGEYDPLNWTVRWIYKSIEETDTTSRYQYDSVLVYNTSTQAFYPWNIATTAGVPYINGLAYIQSPGGSTAPDPVIKYIVSKAGAGTFTFTFAEEKDITLWKDWNLSGTAYNYTSFFTSGYKIAGQALKKFQIDYINLFLNNYVNMSYRMQGIWDFAISGNSGKFSSLERTDITESVLQFGIVHRRHRIRGRGLVLQFKVTSVDGSPFDIIGWSVDERINTNV